VPPPEPERLARVAEATVAAPAVDARMDLVRAALTAELEEVAPAQMGLGLRGFSSSRDFHLLFRLRDEKGTTLAAHYTGYEGSHSQLRYLPLELAARHFAPLIENIRLENREPSEAHRRLFAERFLDAAPRFDDDFTWWVKEREVALAQELGTPAVIEALLPHLAKAGDDRSTVDTRRDALAAIARISGWDLLHDASGKPRPIGEAARDALAECRRALASRR
jgi:hypothetical protein